MWAVAWRTSTEGETRPRGTNRPDGSGIIQGLQVSRLGHSANGTMPTLQQYLATPVDLLR